jgi:hypothetical protein
MREGDNRKRRDTNRTTIKLSKSLNRLLRRQADRRGMRVYDYTCKVMERVLQQEAVETVMEID